MPLSNTRTMSNNCWLAEMTALLTLEAEQTPCPWSAIEKKLTGWLPGLTTISQDAAKRTYRVNLPDHRQPIALLQELQKILAPEEVHFFIDLTP